MKLFSIFFVIAVFIFTSCNEPSIIGSDIIPSEDNINVVFTDTISLKTTTEVEDSVKVYDTNPALQPNRYMVGNVNDADFGHYASDIYTQLELLSTNPDFEGGELDSIVLSLAYDDRGFYGSLEQSFHLQVFEVEEYMNPNFDYFSNKTFATSATPLADVNFIPAPSDSVLVDSVLLKPHIRIPLDAALGNRFLNVTDTSVFENDDFFTNYFNGIKLVGSFPSNESMLAFDLLDEMTKIELFYTVGDTLQKTFTFRIKSGSTKTMNFTHDYIGSNVATFIGDVSKGDSLTFVQSMVGLDVKVEMPHITNLSNIIVNKAELIVTVAQDADSDNYPIPEQLILLRANENGEKIVINDVTTSLTRTSGFSVLFGGQPNENEVAGETVIQYNMNISSFLQDVISGNIADETLYITTFPKSDFPNRLILGGAKHSKYQMKIQLTYTKLD